MIIAKLRREYQKRICREIVRISGDSAEYPNFADKVNKASKAIAWGIVNRLDCPAKRETISPQTVGRLFEEITKDFLEKAFQRLHHLRPGDWTYSTRLPISSFEQYEHLAHLEKMVKESSELASALGTDYVIKPDIVIGRQPVSEKEVNRQEPLVDLTQPIAMLTPLRSANSENPSPSSTRQHLLQMDNPQR
ncbi:MAG: hypothetical protein JW918_00420 [Anaerolineae bacterium]|nr:hypothetical protein [Anaerolineae bacterium]